jgi:predicted transcriptional regulator
MAQFNSDQEQLQESIQQNLQDLAAQMGEPITSKVATQLYQEATDLLAHLSYEPITLARLAGTLLVYQLQPIEPEELKWLKTQIMEATEAEEVEELIESMSRESL